MIIGGNTHMQDLHIHIRDCIGNPDKLQEFVDKGKNYNINEFCFLEHGNRISKKHHGFLDSYDSIDLMKETINNVINKNRSVKIYNGIEIDYSHDKKFRKRTLELLRYGNFDIVIGSIHSYRFENGIDYFNSILDMINNYPINIIGHIKLTEDWKEYKEILKRIINECSNKNIKIEINTSSRSIWNEEQFDFMIDTIFKHNASFTCGSDAHHIDEIGANYKVLKKKIK